MLDVDGRDDVNAGVEQVEHILPALRVPRGAGHVGMGEFIDQRHAGAAAQHTVQVHLLEPAAVVFADAAGDDLQARGVSLGHGPVVVLDGRDDDVVAERTPALAFVKHGDGLARSRGGSQVDAEVVGSCGAGVSHPPSMRPPAVTARSTTRPRR